MKCGQFIPDSYRKPVEGAQLPPRTGATISDVLRFGNDQTAQLALANGRTGDVIALVTTCDAAVTEMEKKLKPKPFWKFWG